VLVIALAYVPARRMYEASPLSWPKDTFTEPSWRASPRSERFRLYKDLDRRGLLHGRTKQGVLDLLGIPDSEAPDGQYIGYVLREWDGKNSMLYALWIVQIDLDARGRVKRYFVRHE
jgi:hypothetical protein